MRFQSFNTTLDFVAVYRQTERNKASILYIYDTWNNLLLVSIWKSSTNAKLRIFVHFFNSYSISQSEIVVLKDTYIMHSGAKWCISELTFALLI